MTPLEQSDPELARKIDFNEYWRMEVELDDRYDMDEAVEIRKEERRILLEDMIERYKSVNNY